MAAYYLERFEFYTKEIFDEQFCSPEIKKVSKPEGEYDSILELSVGDNVDSDTAGEICVKLDQLLEKAPAFAKAYGKIDRADGTFLIWLAFEDILPFDLNQRVSLFCYDLDSDASLASVSVMQGLENKYNCHLRR